MENKLLDNIFKSSKELLPVHNSMDDYLLDILPRVVPWSEDLYEREYYLDTRWLEIRDDVSFHESVLHIFREKGEYLQSVDGNITKGSWRVLDKSNTLILDVGNKSELYDLAFLNRDFFILSKHGDQKRKGQKIFFVLGRENYVSSLEWREIMELLHSRYQSNTQIIVITTIIILVVIIVIAFSLF